MVDTKKHWEECGRREGLASVMSVRWGEEESQKATDGLKRELKLALESVEAPILNLTEIGCGIGRIMASLVDWYPKAKATGIDLSSTMLERAKGVPALKDVTFVNSRAIEQPNEFWQQQDLVVTCTVLEHIIEEPEWWQTVQRIKQARVGALLCEEITDVNRRASNSTDMIRSLHDYLGVMCPEFGLVHFRKFKCLDDGYGVMMFVRRELLPWRFK